MLAETDLCESLSDQSWTGVDLCANLNMLQEMRKVRKMQMMRMVKRMLQSQCWGPRIGLLYWGTTPMGLEARDWSFMASQQEKDTGQKKLLLRLQVHPISRTRGDSTSLKLLIESKSPRLCIDDLKICLRCFRDQYLARFYPSGWRIHNPRNNLVTIVAIFLLLLLSFEESDGAWDHFRLLMCGVHAFGFPCLSHLS